MTEPSFPASVIQCNGCGSGPQAATRFQCRRLSEWDISTRPAQARSPPWWQAP
ncbi:MAG: hypothetical protein ED554_05800 [Synechococcus sp. YX04-3]|nr:MAG: hypothetical protein ED554_05800 [Synechococcus sp. YX04-3]